MRFPCGPAPSQYLPFLPSTSRFQWLLPRRLHTLPDIWQRGRDESRLRRAGRTVKPLASAAGFGGRTKSSSSSSANGAITRWLHWWRRLGHILVSQVHHLELVFGVVWSQALETELVAGTGFQGRLHLLAWRCVPVYQRSSVRVLTRFTAQDSLGRTTYLLGSSDWFVDVTELVRNWLRVEDPRVASLDSNNNLIGLRPGKTSLHVISEQWDGMLGGCDITVTSEPVTPGDLSVQVVSGIGMSVADSPTHPSIVTTTVTAFNILYDHHQEASISVWLQFSDDTASLLSSFWDLPFFLHLSSLAETVVVVTPIPSQRIFAKGDGGGPLLRAELLVSTCTDQPITSNSISEGERDWMDSGRGGTRRLAGGSGWIRVNLDHGFLLPDGERDEEGDKFGLHITDTLVESDSDIYAANFDGDESENVSSDYFNKINVKRPDTNWNDVWNRGMVSQNNLERAVLMPSLEEGVVYFSPSQEKEEEGEEGQGEGEEGQGGGELKLGVGAVLSLLCLSAVLFLANCLPCALQDRRSPLMGENREAGLERAAEKEEEQEREKMEVEKSKKDERNKTEGEDRIKQHDMNNKEDIKEVEIIC